MTRIFVSIGSNVDPNVNLRLALAALLAKFDNVSVSPVYESQAVGFAGDNFFNAVLACDTGLPLNDTLDALSGIETALGRTRTGKKFESRTIDLDLLTFGDTVVDMTNVRIPREEILRYAFVLRPLAELAPDETHPILHRTYRDLWGSFADVSQRLWKIDFDWRANA